MAADVLQVLDEAGVGRAHVVGASLGGMIAQEVAAAAPDRVDRLVLCCTTPGGDAQVPMPEVTVRLFQEAASLEPLEALHRFVVNALGPGAPGPLVEEIYRRRVENPPDPVGWQGQAAAGTTFPGVDGTITAPVLVLHGTADNVVAVGNAQLLGGRVELFEGAGHLFFWEQPERFVRIVTEFLS
jgi:pimeloyl-ACP methyl ester carboxylesterase